MKDLFVELTQSLKAIVSSFIIELMVLYKYFRP